MRFTNLMTQQNRKRRPPTPRSAKTSMLEAAQRFGDPQVAEAWLRDQRWPDGVHCPRCGADNPSTKTRKNSPLTWYVRRNRIPGAQEGDAEVATSQSIQIASCTTRSLRWRSGVWGSSSSLPTSKVFRVTI